MFFKKLPGKKQQIKLLITINAVFFLVTGCIANSKISGSIPGISKEKLIYSSYLGGTRDDMGQGICIGPDGKIYLVGVTSSPDFPVINGFQEKLNPDRRNPLDGFISVLSPDGKTLLYSTYVGGNYYDYADDCALADDGSLLVTGKTLSKNFPTLSPFQADNKGKGDAFILRLSSEGELLNSSFFGGSRGENLRAPGRIDIAPDGRVYISGTTPSQDFPLLNPIPGAGGTGSDAFVALFDSAGKTLLYSTRLGGSRTDFSFGMALDPAGRPCLTGQTGSRDFPTSPGSLPYTGKPGHTDAWVTILDLEKGKIIYSSFLGGSQWDFGHGVAFLKDGTLLVTGRTNSPDFPTIKPIQGEYGGGSVSGDLFIAGIDPSSPKILFSSYLGGSGDEPVNSRAVITVDSDDRIWVAAASDSKNFPQAGQMPFQTGTKTEICLSSLSPDGQILELSGLLGGEGHDFPQAISSGPRGVFLTGGTYSSHFPTRSAFQGHPGNPHGPEAEEDYADAFIIGLENPGLMP